ncbi:MAG: hypothetical protein HKN34_08795 [Gammaproteobacteria bacterium]|nr:hypothetical protein [Gammaproteobacteria bacterium]
MSRDKKLAIILAPFLLVAGYVLSDLYIEGKANAPRFFEFTPDGNCALFITGCILRSGDMEIDLTDENGITRANTSFPVDTVAISLVYDSGKEIIYELKKAANPQYWERATDLRKAMIEDKTAKILRVAVKRKGSTYLSQFSPVAVSDE